MANTTRQHEIWRQLVCRTQDRGWAYTLNAARRTGNSEAVHQLEAIAPYFAPGHPALLKDIYTERKVSDGGLDAGGGNDWLISAAVTGHDTGSGLATLVE